MSFVYFITNRKASFVRGLLTLALGICLLLWPTNTIGIIIKLIAGFLVLMGIITLVFSLNANGNNGKSGIPFIVVFNVLIYTIFGVLIFIFPNFFLNLIAFLFGAVLLIAGIGQLINLYHSSKYTILSGWIYIIPTLVTICGIALFFFTKESTTTLTIVFGGAVTLYGVSELYSAWVLRKVRFNKDGVYEQRLEETASNGDVTINTASTDESKKDDFAEDVPFEEVKDE